jgi:hypothetical protein
VLHLFVWRAIAPDQLAFAIGVVAFAAGALLLMSADGEEDRRDLTEDPDPPPWWPDFEREFRAYARSSRPRARV